MKNLFFALLIIGINSITTDIHAQCGPLSTPYVDNNGQSGIMFDVVAITSVEITQLAMDFTTGTFNMEIYCIDGTHVGSETTPAAWTLLGTVNGWNATGGTNVLIPIVFSKLLCPGQSAGFYVTASNSTGGNYSNGTGVGNVAAADANIQILEGTGKAYPFSTNFTPRVPNVTVSYNCMISCCLAPTLVSTQETCPNACDGTATATIGGGGVPPYSYQWYDNLGNPIGIDDPTLSGVCDGDYSVEVTDGSGCISTNTVTVTTGGALDDATFVSGDFCEASVNTISGIITPGGIFSISSQTGSGGVTIDPVTGILSNYLMGDQITIMYTTPAAGCQNSSTQIVNVTGLDDATFVSADFCESAVNTISGVITTGGTYSITSQTGSGGVTVDPSTGVLSNFVAGDQITIQYLTPAAGCQNSSEQIVNVMPLDDASFSTSDFCESSVNTITGVATLGGTYSISSQTGSGGVTIDPLTGVLSNYVGGDQVTIQYTTPAAGCQNSSTQIVNVTPLDDPSFVATDFCESSILAISNIAIPGGVFSISSQTGSGGITIDPVTGAILNYVGGDQVTIMYTTPAAGCQNSSTQVVNILPLDDASFVSADFCASDVNTISGVITVGGTFSISAQTGSGVATIDPATGLLSNYVGGDQVTIEYTTPVTGCQNTSTQIINVIPLEDPSFTSFDFCESSVNTISGVTTPGGSFSINSQTGSGGVNIDPVTGILSNYFAGDQISIQYLTPATGCQDSSIQVVNVTLLDDPSFVSSDFCESSVNSISGVATPAGTFSILSQTGSGSVTVDPTTGILANYLGGDQITIEYLTPNSGCQNSSSLQVNVLIDDDPSFSMTPSCNDALSFVTGTTGGVFSFSTSPLDGAIIDATTGAVSNGNPGASYSVVYNTTGVCPASFTYSLVLSYCEITVPTAITPNQDGNNDTWEILDLDNIYPDNTVKIYNRLGNLIYEHDSKVNGPYNSNQWDGTFNGNSLPVASYFFIVEFNNGLGENVTGAVSILKP